MCSGTAFPFVGNVEGEVDADFALGVGPGAVGGAVGGGAGFAFAGGRGEDGFDLGGGEERARGGELGVQGLGEGEGGEGEDGWDEREEPGRAWGHGWALCGVRCLLRGRGGLRGGRGDPLPHSSAKYAYERGTRQMVWFVGGPPRHVQSP